MTPPHPFDLRRSPYIALARREDAGVPDDNPVRAAIYAPATVCAYYADHAARSLSCGRRRRSPAHPPHPASAPSRLASTARMCYAFGGSRF
jgi:hypothetical protein